MIYSVKPYNQRLTTLNTHQQLAPVQRRHHRYAQEGFGEAATAKDVNFFMRTLILLRRPPRSGAEKILPTFLEITAVDADWLTRQSRFPTQHST